MTSTVLRKNIIQFKGALERIGTGGIIPKGQLISKCLFEKIVWTKIPTKNLIDSAQQVSGQNL